MDSERSPDELVPVYQRFIRRFELEVLQYFGPLLRHVLHTLKPPVFEGAKI